MGLTGFSTKMKLMKTEFGGLLCLPRISWEGQTVKPLINDVNQDLQWLFYVIGFPRVGHCDTPESPRFAHLAS